MRSFDYADTCVPEPPCFCTNGLHVPASCVAYVPEAQGSWRATVPASGLRRALEYRYRRRKAACSWAPRTVRTGTRPRRGRAVRTMYRVVHHRLSSVSNWDPLGIALGTPLRTRTPDDWSNLGHIGKGRTLE